MFFQQLATVKYYAPILLVSLLASAQASVLSTTNIATVLVGATSQSSLTILAAAMAAIAKLGTGGATASTLGAAGKAAIASCPSAAQANNTASKAGMGAVLEPREILRCESLLPSDFRWSSLCSGYCSVTNKISTHACESAGQQISLAAGGAGGSDTSINLLISNVGVVNANTDAAGITSKKRSVGFMA
jgi:hypothetical protein